MDPWQSTGGKIPVPDSVLLGAPCWIRTNDRLLRRQPLSPVVDRDLGL